ncbi:KamA family radical SAM protein [Clostridium tagluense]|uniref:KamA family radical SAM protein n=1 Tax=Clostridium tagluense TaxID=360422 RepID=UPI001CF34B8C|nr:KamA family radical SAM protein [Clostridium tagluense]MCB2298648.1 KamA family radical SAM protein [Clostridium tagluense]
MSDKFTSREISLQRAEQLKATINSYLEEAEFIKTGFDNYERIQCLKQKILEIYNATDEQWDDWKWQFKNCIHDVEILEKIIDVTKEEKAAIIEVEKKFRWSVSPYYLSLMNPLDANCPIRMQAIPQIHELESNGKVDPMAEEFTSPVEGITRRYPDRLIINVTNQCATFCRHCQRRRNIGVKDVNLSKEKLEACFEYIRQNPEIRDVLVTGGDVLCLSDNMIIWILSELRKISTVEIIRIGTRALVTMPQRITDDLCKKLQEFHPLYINTQFNSPAEITQEALEACDKLTKAGIPLGNQTVLLKNINNDVNKIKKLNQQLLKIRVRPYYIFHPKDVIGTSHFCVKITEGLKIMEGLRGQTSGLAIPTYVLNTPNGKGKVPLQSSYILGVENNCVKIRTWEGDIIHYEEL